MNITQVAVYREENTGIVITVSKRSGGMGSDDYLITGTNKFAATRTKRHEAIEAALAELRRIAKNAKAS